MVDRTTCSGKYELLYRELEKRATSLMTSVEDLETHGCTITDHPKVLDCVIGFDTHMDDDGHVTTKCIHKYGAFHFVAKRSLRNIGSKQAVLVSANWLEDAINYWRLHIKENERMMVVIFYNDFYFFLDVKQLAIDHGFKVKKTRDKFTKTIPCYNPQSNSKEMNRVVLIPAKWAEKYGYMTSKEDRGAIFNSHKECANEEDFKKVMATPEGKPVFAPYLPITNPTLVGDYKGNGISPLI